MTTGGNNVSQHPAGEGGASLARRIEVLRPGTFKPMTGEDVSFSADDLAGIAERYDPKLHAAPLVVGHPKTDDPAFAWAARFAAAGDRLVASLSDVHPDIDKAVAEGRFRKVSLSLFAPQAPNNPTPGHHYPKHIGLLGAAAPAVSHLKPVTEAAFAADEDVVITLAAPPAASAIANLFSALRDMLVERDGREAADKVIPDFEVSWLQSDNAWDTPAPAAGTEFATAPTAQETPSTMPQTTSSGGGPSANQPPAQSTDFAAREAALRQREQALARQEHERFLDQQITAGKFPPALKAETLDFMGALSNADSDVVAFGTADEKRTPLSQFKRLVAHLPQQVPLGEAAAETGAGRETEVSFAAPADAEVDAERLKIHQQALDYQRQHPNTDYVAAVRAVGGGHV